MSALWITSYLLIVICGASLTIVGFLRLELWLQTRRVRSRYCLYRQKRLRVDSAPESVIAAKECVDADRSVAKSYGVQVQLKRESEPRPGVEPVKARSLPDKKRPIAKGEPERSTGAGQVGVGQSGLDPHAATNARSASATRSDRPETKPRGAGADLSDAGNRRSQPSTTPQPRQAIPGTTLDELYDSEVPTVIGSELVDEDEGQPDFSPDDIIEAGVL